MRLVPIVDTAVWRSFEAEVFAQQDSYAFMERAGHKIFAQLQQVLRTGELAGANMPCSRRYDFTERLHQPVLVVAGPGNNGGDALVVARLLHQHQIPYQLLTVVDPATWQGDAARAWQQYVQLQAPYQLASRAEFLPSPPEHPYLLVLDGILGTGQRSPLKPHLAAVEQWVAQLNLPVFALDVPTGNLSATWTVVLGAPRTEVYARQNYGQWVWEDLGMPAAVAENSSPQIFALQLERFMPPPHPWQHKYQQAVVGVSAGSAYMPGAAQLCCSAALRTGASLVNLCVDENWPPSYSAILPEVVLRSRKDEDPAWRSKIQAWCIGPGLEDSPAQRKRFTQLWDKRTVPWVVDATALNFLAPVLQASPNQGPPVIITPHEGEWQRLWGEPAPSNFKARVSQVATAAQQWKLIIVLKGPTTLIANPHGAVAVWHAPQGALAKAGMGDVLAGIITTLCAQGMEPWQAACNAVMVHSRTGIVAQQQWGQRALQASDMPAFLPKVLQECRL